MLRQAIACDDPVIFFEPKRRYWDKAEVDEAVDAGACRCSARVARPGYRRDHRLLRARWSAPASEAAAAAEAEGRDLEVIDLRSLSPVDLDLVCDSVERTGRLVVVHEASGVARAGRRDRRAGAGARASTRSRRRCCGWAASHTPYPPSRIEEHYLPDLDRVLDAVDRAMEH